MGNDSSSVRRRARRYSRSASKANNSVAISRERQHRRRNARPPEVSPFITSDQRQHLLALIRTIAHLRASVHGESYRSTRKQIENDVRADARMHGWASLGTLAQADYADVLRNLVVLLQRAESACARARRIGHIARPRQLSLPLRSHP